MTVYHGISLPSASDMDGKVNALLNSGISDSSSEEELDLSKLKQDYFDDTETGPASTMIWLNFLTASKRQT